MQDPMSFNQFARQLPEVFDTIAKRGEKVLVEKDGVLFRLEPEETPQNPDICANYAPEKARDGYEKAQAHSKALILKR